MSKENHKNKNINNDESNSNLNIKSEENKIIILNDLKDEDQKNKFNEFILMESHRQKKSNKGENDFKNKQIIFHGILNLENNNTKNERINQEIIDSEKKLILIVI